MAQSRNIGSRLQEFVKNRFQNQAFSPGRREFLASAGVVPVGIATNSLERQKKRIDSMARGASAIIQFLRTRRQEAPQAREGQREEAEIIRQQLSQMIDSLYWQEAHVSEVSATIENWLLPQGNELPTAISPEQVMGMQQILAELEKMQFTPEQRENILFEIRQKIAPQSSVQLIYENMSLDEDMQPTDPNVVIPLPFELNSLDDSGNIGSFFRQKEDFVGANQDAIRERLQSIWDAFVANQSKAFFTVRSRMMIPILSEIESDGAARHEPPVPIAGTVEFSLVFKCRPNSREISINFGVSSSTWALYSEQHDANPESYNVDPALQTSFSARGGDPDEPGYIARFAQCFTSHFLHQFPAGTQGDANAYTPSDGVGGNRSGLTEGEYPPYIQLDTVLQEPEYQSSLFRLFWLLFIEKFEGNGVISNPKDV